MSLQRRASFVAVVALAAILVGIFALYPPLSFVSVDDYDRTTVTVIAENGTELATLEARVAETRDQRRVGLSRTDALANSSGMLFVHDSRDTRSYHMENMSFGIDIVFVDPDGTITEIHEAPHPDEAGTGPYTGTGQYVLEVPLGWTDDVGATPGDRVVIPEDVQS